MDSLNFPRRQCVPAAFRPLLTATFTLLLSYAAAAQNAPTPVTALTGDKVLYGRPSPRAGNSKRLQPPTGIQAQGLTRHERKIARRKYRDQHRDEFPSMYRPGVE